MPQQEIIKLLSENPGRKFTNMELSQRLNIGTRSIATSVRKLIYYRQVESTVMPEVISLKRYGKFIPCKRFIKRIWI